MFWLCVFAGVPGAETTPFTDAEALRPGDEDLEHCLDGAALVAALDLVVPHRRAERGTLWTMDMLAAEIRR